MEQTVIKEENEMQLSDISSYADVITYLQNCIKKESAQILGIQYDISEGMMIVIGAPMATKMSYQIKRADGGWVATSTKYLGHLGSNVHEGSVKNSFMECLPETAEEILLDWSKKHARAGGMYFK